MKKNVRRGFIINGNRLKHWAELSDAWATLHERYCRIMSKDYYTDSRDANTIDAAYSHGELGNVAILTAAAYQIGWVAASESPSIKKKKKRTGRSDAYFASFEHAEYVEAKAGFVTLDENSKITSSFKKNIENSISDALDTAQDDIDESAVAVTFLVLEQAAGQEQETINIDNLVGSITNSFSSIQLPQLALKQRGKIGPDLIAWCMPEDATNLHWDKDYIYPGVVMVASRVR